MANITIGEVARRAGLKTSAIRYYEKIGLLPKTQRIGGQRRYEPGVLNYLEVIDVAKRAGFRMDEIRHLFHGFGKGIPASRRWQLLAQRKITEMDDLIARAKKMKRLLEKADRCKCLALEDCGKAFLVQSGTSRSIPQKTPNPPTPKASARQALTCRAVAKAK